MQHFAARLTVLSLVNTIGNNGHSELKRWFIDQFGSLFHKVLSFFSGQLIIALNCSYIKMAGLVRVHAAHAIISSGSVIKIKSEC